ncbi:hypothetical protein ACQ4PT_022335 [Festuca glaucescens]
MKMARALHLLFVAVLASCLVAALGLSGGAADAVAGRKMVGVYELRKGDFSIKNGSAYFGGLIGRVANRIAGARFKLDGKAYRLFPNDGNNTLHGDLDVYVKYQISSPHVLSVRMNATARDKATPVNLAHHAYTGTSVAMAAAASSARSAVDTVLIPTGQLAPVASTPYDFRRPAAVGARMGWLLRRGVTGYDTNYAVDGGERGGLRRQLRRVAIVRDGASGRVMELWADQPGVQLYTANGLSRVRGKGGKVYDRYDALCLETQGFPDAVNRPNFPPQIVRPGQVYSHDMVFKFSF